jgi:hypothetical protein
VHDLLGHWIPGLSLETWTVLYFLPGAFAPGTPGLPPGWGDIPGAAGCTLESMKYASRAADIEPKPSPPPNPKPTRPGRSVGVIGQGARTWQGKRGRS